MPYTNWYHLYNLKTMKNIHGGVLLLKVKLLRGGFHVFKLVQNCAKHHIFSSIAIFYYIQEFGSRFMSIEKKSLWTVGIINECYVYCFSLRWSINSWNNYCVWNKLIQLCYYIEWANHTSGLCYRNSWKNNNDLMQECFIQFVMLYKFNQIRRNRSWLSSQF